MDSELKQYKNIYQSTLEFDNFLKVKLKNSKKLIDIGCGKGGTLSFYAKKYKKLKIYGIDYRSKNINASRKYFRKFKIDKNVKFQKVNILKNINNKDLKNPDGIISQKTFNTFDNIEKPLNNLIKLKPKWIGLNSLFFKGKMDVLIHIRDRENKYYELKDNDPDGDFNIFSISNLKKYLKTTNYKITKIKPFFPKKKLRKIGDNRGTYTIKTEFSDRTCFSGPVYLPWYFVLIEKI
tara:strand:- start:581 stop:1288 length:708 start_codon:yes stop_codon:yes gene_type:complete